MIVTEYMENGALDTYLKVGVLLRMGESHDLSLTLKRCFVEFSFK